MAPGWTASIPGHDLVHDRGVYVLEVALRKEKGGNSVTLFFQNLARRSLDRTVLELYTVGAFLVGIKSLPGGSL